MDISSDTEALLLIVMLLAMGLGGGYLILRLIGR